MFGQPNDNQQAATDQNASSTQSPSMLDNVSTQDLQGQPAAGPSVQPQAAADPQAAVVAAEHPLTTDNPFAAQPATATPSTSQPTPATPTLQDPAFTTVPSQPAAQQPAPSQPAPSVVYHSTTSDNSDDSTSGASAVDHDKLADMKQEAMSHLEPLVDHIDGSPEETFKTTMMMIQANDNHTLLDKALAAAKSIENDKARAEALLDIINEINYFSQTNQTSD